MTCCAASSERARKPSDERSASGSSRCQTRRSSEIVSSANESSSSWWSAPSDVGDEPRVGELVARAGLREADRERLHRPVHLLRHQRDDQARVEAAAEHRAERHVAHQPQADGLLELGEQALAPLLDAAAALERRLPGSSSSARSSTAPFSITRMQPGSSFLHSGERRRRRREEAERQDRRRSPRSRGRSGRARWRAGSSARRRRRARSPQTA